MQKYTSSCVPLCLSLLLEMCCRASEMVESVSRCMVTTFMTLFTVCINVLTRWTRMLQLSTRSANFSHYCSLLFMCAMLH